MGDELPVEVFTASFGKSVHLLLPITSRYPPPTAACSVCAVNHIVAVAVDGASAGWCYCFLVISVETHYSRVLIQQSYLLADSASGKLL